MKTLMSILIIFLHLLVVNAQDYSGVKDPPLLERLPGFEIYDYRVTNFGGYKFCNENGEELLVEGMVTYYYYETDGEVKPSKIIEKFTAAVTGAGGTVYGDDPQRKYMVYYTKDKSIWIDLYAEDFYYTLNIVEKGEKLSKITTEELSRSLRVDGRAILYFNFDHNECELKAECLPVVEMIAEVLKAESSLKLQIAGYTDDVGRSDENLVLSSNRARAINDKLVELGIAQDRLSFIGKGELDPLADNNSVEGRALNNRIVLIRK